MRVVFAGATDLGYRCCEELLRLDVELAGILTMPAEFSISYAERPVRNVTHRSFRDLAARHGVPLLELEDGMRDPAVGAQIAEWQPDFGLAVGWFYLVPADVRDLFPLGFAGIHASLLPRYRGGAPLVWAILNGETETGVTLFYLDDGVDTGDVVAQRVLTIGREDTIADVYAAATEASIGLVREQVPLIAAGTAARIAQDESLATTFPQRSPADGRIDWSRSAKEIHDFIRAQTRPYPGAFTVIAGKRVTIWDATVVDDDAHV